MSFQLCDVMMVILSWMSIVFLVSADPLIIQCLTVSNPSSLVNGGHSMRISLQLLDPRQVNLNSAAVAALIFEL